MNSLLSELVRHLEAGEAVATATIVYQDGSAPRGAGSKLLADARGLLCGTTGGGLAEAQAIEACAQALRSGQATELNFVMDGRLAANAEMICGGQVRLLIEPFLPDSAPLALLRQAAQDERGGGCVALRPFPPDGTMPWSLLTADGRLLGALLTLTPEELAKLRGMTEAAVVCAGGKTLFAEPYCPAQRLIIAGGGHVSRPTVTAGALAGFEVHVLDDRAEFARPERFPEAASTRVVPDFAHCFDELAPGTRDYIVIVTRGHLHDGTVLAQALRTEATYIGMIGSSRKKEQVFQRMREEGFTQKELERVHSPIGLAIGAETPEEIAISIIAQCIAHRRGAPCKRGR